MSDTLTRYRAVEYELPTTYLSWDLFGKGLEKLGRDGKPVELPLREPKEDELLLRVDALGLCFSDTKLIWAGDEHPRIRGRDLEADPTVAGHEAAMTVVKVGAKWADKFAVGQRYIIQADIFVKGEQKAFGYVQRGAMAQYAYVDGGVLDGDDGCYLLPMRESTGYAEAALVEPWACVEAAYHIPLRTAPEPEGRLLIVYAGKTALELEGLYPEGKGPVASVVLGEPQCALTPVLGDVGRLCKNAPTAARIAEAVQDEGEGIGFDDIILVGQVDAALVEACDKALAPKGVLCFVSGQAPAPAAIDIGRVHYHYTRHVGATGNKVIDAYKANDRKELKPGGACWMIGAAGPMGQMHVQRALELDEPPAKLYATDISQERLEYLRNRLAPLAERKGVELVIRDVSNPEGLDEELKAFTGGAGFDDVYVHAPVAKLVEHAGNFLAEGAVFNVFAGVPLGTLATLAPAIFTEKHVRLIGSSGSSMDDIKGVLRKCEDRKLATRMSLAALGGIETVWEGIKGVKEGRFPGKTVIFPQLTGLPLTGLDEIEGVAPEVVEHLETGHVWTNAAEEALLAKRLAL